MDISDKSKLCVQGKRKGRIRLNSIEGEGMRGREKWERMKNQEYRWSLGEKREKEIEREESRDRERGERERPISIL